MKASSGICINNNPVGTINSAYYILDDYTAIAAYSFRQLKTGVTDVTRIRRSSDSAELDFTPTEITDGTLTTWTGAGDGFVVTMYNQDGAADITQATAGAQPKIVSTGSLLTKGGLPCMLFDGSDDQLKNFAAGFINSVSTSYFSVSSSAGTETNGTVHHQSNTTNETIRTFQDSRTTPTRNLAVTNNAPTSYLADLSTARVNTDQRLLSSFIDSGKAMAGFDNGATGGTATYTSTIDNDGLRLGSQASSTFLSGEIQEFIAFNTDETSNRSTIESDINTHYSIY